MSMSTGVWLGVDYGTAVTVAVLRWPDGTWRELHVDGALVLPSAVFAADGEVVAGTAALARAVAAPQSLVATPLRHLTEGSVSVAGESVDVVELVAATLRLVHAHAQRTVGEVGQVRLVVPGWWGPRHRAVMRQAAHRAGWGEPVLVNRPLAVACGLVDDGLVIPVGSWVGVCDVGTRVEASVVRRSVDGLETVSVIDRDAGGDRLDQTLVEYLTGPDASLPSTAGGPREAPIPEQADRQADRQTDQQVVAAARQARAALGCAQALTVALPAPWHPIVLTAGQVQALLEPVLDEASKTMAEAIEAADVDAAACAGVYLTGGGGPLEQVADRVRAAAPGPGGSSGLPVEVIAAPKLAPVLGAVRASPLVTATVGDEAGPGGDDVQQARPRVG